MGFCWEPFDRFNRATSRGRIVIPMYPRNLYLAILTAVADLRWQVAKEKASFYWMEEGLTGHYYQWFQSNKLNRIAPYVLLIPTYGDTGFCWEPFDRYNRATSRGRIVVPMYPRNLYIAVLTAVADLRWQVAKEKASFYWMEEGLTGNYYQWFQSLKLKGDIKEYFIRDYILWMTKEAEGIQKLDKDVRGTFWRHMPFTREVKEKLKNRSFDYQELYQRDMNRAMSDGY
jgi:hypothetical protein